MCRNMVDIQSATAEIRRGKKKKQDKNIMSASATQGGHNKSKQINEALQCKAYTVSADNLVN